MKKDSEKKLTQIPLKKKLLTGDLDVPATGASFAKAVWIWPV